MAEISDDVLERFIEKLEDMVSKGIPIGPDLEKLIKDYKNGLLSTIKGLKGVTDSVDKYSKKLKDGTVRAGDLGGVIRQLNDTISEMDDGYRKEAARERAQVLEKRYVNAQATKVIKDASIETAKAMTMAGMAIAQGLLQNLTSSASGFKIASDVMIGGLDFQNKAVNSAAGAAQGLGNAMLATGNKKLAGFGAALTIGAEAVKFFSDVTTQAAKFAIGFLTAEAEKLVNSFESASSAGAVFTDGMTGLRNAATDAGVTQEQFTNVLKQNNAVFAESGLTVSGAAKRLGDVGKAIRESKLDREMLALGFGFEEQVEMSAKILADMRKIGMKADDPTVAKATADYAKNLRVIADITGEDAKKRMEEARQAAMQYAFRAKVEEEARRVGDPTLWTRVSQSLALMSDTQRKAAIQSVVLNGAITDVGANLMGMRPAAQAFRDNLFSGAFSVEQSMRGFTAVNDRFASSTDQMGAAISMGAIATGQNADLAKQYAEQQDIAMKVTSNNLAQAIKDAEAAKQARDELTNQFISVALQAQEMKRIIQDDVTEALKQFATVVNGTLREIRKNLGEYGISTGSAEVGLTGYDRKTPGPDEKGLVTRAQEGKWISKGLSGAAVGAGLASGAALVTGVGAPAAAAIAGIAGMLELASMLAGMAGYAKGGISEGPESGYIEKLHGTEAVVPLPDGKTIPVAVTDKTPPIDIGPLTVVLQEILDVNKDNRDYLEKLFHASV